MAKDCREDYAHYLNVRDCWEAARLCDGMGLKNCREYDPVKYYVYVLADPDTRKAFYIGKGKSARWRCHEMDAKAFRHVNAKVGEKIVSLARDGKEHLAICVRDGLSESQAYNLEAYLIANVDGTFNGAKGRMTNAQRQLAFYKSLPDVKFGHLFARKDGEWVKGWLYDHCVDIYWMKRNGIEKWQNEVDKECAAA